MQDKDMSKKTSNESAETIDKLVREIAETKDWSVINLLKNSANVIYICYGNDCFIVSFQTICV